MLIFYFILIEYSIKNHFLSFFGRGQELKCDENSDGELISYSIIQFKQTKFMGIA